MAKQLAFYFNSSQCSGCKACQIACKGDINVFFLWLGFTPLPQKIFVVFAGIEVFKP